MQGARPFRSVPETPLARTINRRARIVATLAATVVSIMLISTSSLTAQAFEDGTSSVSGVITDADGEPVAGLTVGLTAMSYLSEVDLWRFGSTKYATTTSDGAYVLSGFGAGTYTIGFSCPNCATRYLDEWWDDTFERLESTRFELAAGEARLGMDAVVSTGASVSGRVTATDGSPLEGITVRVWAGKTYWQGKTDVEGAYRIDRLLPAQYTLEFVPPAGSAFASEWWGESHSKYNARQFALGKDQQQAGMDATLERTGTISGVVRDEHGVPIDATVTKIPQGGFVDAYASSLGAAGFTFKGQIGRASCRERVL